jgi:glycosyltransferase involved in cell wall biosynthesis
MSVLEAMKAGVPVIGGKAAGGVPWTLDFGRSGVLVDVRDSDAISDAIIRIFRGCRAATSIVEAARTRVDEVFDRFVVANKYINIYETLRGDMSRKK